MARKKSAKTKAFNRKHPRYRSGPKKGEFKPKAGSHKRKKRNPTAKPASTRAHGKRMSEKQRKLRAAEKRYHSALHACAVEMGRKGYAHSPVAKRKSRKGSKRRKS